MVQLDCSKRKGVYEILTAKLDSRWILIVTLSMRMYEPFFSKFAHNQSFDYISM